MRYLSWFTEQCVYTVGLMPRMSRSYFKNHKSQSSNRKEDSAKNIIKAVKSNLASLGNAFLFIVNMNLFVKGKWRSAINRKDRFDNLRWETVACHLGKWPSKVLKYVLRNSGSSFLYCSKYKRYRQRLQNMSGACAPQGQWYRCLSIYIN